MLPLYTANAMRPSISTASLVLATLFLAACGTVPQAPVGQGVAGMPTQWRPSPNLDERRPNYVIIHQTTSATVGRALSTLLDPERKVSAHYLIGRDGELIQLVDERLRAWHAGESWWGGLTDLNSTSIGIELDNTGEEPFAEPQMLTLLALLGEMNTRHKIPAANVIAHGDIAPRRKVDPSRYFPWKRLADAGYGLWCHAPPANAPAAFDWQLGLATLGYSLAYPEAAIAAFRRHFLALESAAPLSASELALLSCLVTQKTGVEFPR